MRTPRQKRPTLMPAVALAALGAIVALPALSESHLYAAAPQRFGHITVQKGENLWTIADRYTADGENVQDTIDAIEAANGLHSSAVVAGQHLQIPR